MKYKSLALAATLGLAGGAAQATINCSTVTSPGFSMNYVASTTMSTQTYFTVTCSRSAAGDATSIAYTVATNNGLWNGGGNRARHTTVTTQYVSYDTYANSACTMAFAAAGASRIADTITWSSSSDFSTISKDTYFWGCVTASQSGMPAGQFSDTLTLSLRQGTNTVKGTGTAAVNIFAPAACTMNNPPGAVDFNYMAFGAAVGASTTFKVTCTLLMPYTMTLDATSGTLLGLDYTLALSAATATGTGAAQTFSINGNMAAGQGGICTGGSCNSTQARTLTIGY